MLLQLNLNHHTTQAAAMEKMTTFLNQLSVATFKQVEIDNPGKKIVGKMIQFWFTAKQDKNTATISGFVTVNNTDVEISITIPPIVFKYVAKQVIIDQLTAKFNEKFPK